MIWFNVWNQHGRCSLCQFTILLHKFYKIFNWNQVWRELCFLRRSFLFHVRWHSCKLSWPNRTVVCTCIEAAIVKCVKWKLSLLKSLQLPSLPIMMVLSFNCSLECELYMYLITITKNNLQNFVCFYILYSGKYSKFHLLFQTSNELS